MKYICPECGSEIPEENEFCEHCGCLRSKALRTDDQGNFDTTRCPNCGEPITGDENFCGACGAALVKQNPMVMMKPAKYAWVAFALALIPGFFNIFGLGHLVLKKWSRAFMFLALSVILYIVGPALGTFSIFIEVGVFMFQLMDIMNYMYVRGGS